MSCVHHEGATAPTLNMTFDLLMQMDEGLKHTSHFVAA